MPSDVALAQGIPDTDVKVALIHKIMPFIRWPADPSNPPGTARTIAVLGRTALYDRLLEASRAELGNDWPRLRVLSPRSPAKWSDADIVFVAADQSPRLAQILGSCASRGVLSVADTEGFGERGVAVNFYQVANRIRIEINWEALKRAGLGASHTLLSAARVVKEGS